MSIRGNKEPNQRAPEMKRLTHSALELFPHRLQMEYGAARYIQHQVLNMYPAPAMGRSEYSPSNVARVVKQIGTPAMGQSEKMPSDISEMVKPLGSPIVQSAVETVVPATDEYGEFANPELAAYFGGLAANKEAVDA